MERVLNADVRQRVAGIVRALEPIRPVKVILFGSHVRGTADADSDLDLIVVAERVAERYVDRIGEALELLEGKHSPGGIDVFVYTPQEYVDLRARGSALVEDAERDGAVVHERPGVDWPEPGRDAVKDPRRDANAWMEQAETDLAVARDIAERFPPLACFHSQQAAEKALKAILYGTGERTVRGQVIVDLGARVERHSPGYAELRRRISKLDRYYIPTRYPNGGIDPSRTYDAEDAHDAIARAEAAVDHARSFLQDAFGGT